MVFPPPDLAAKTAYEDAKRINTRAAYQAVIDNFPGTVYATLSEEWISKLDEVSPSDQTAETVFWETIKDSEDPADFEAYLTQFPGGLHAQVARHWRDKLRVEADDRAYARADSLGTSEAYRDYLVSYPSSRNAEQAREHLKFIDLLGRKMSPDFVDESRWTDLHYAAVMDLPRIADALLKAGMNVDVRLANDGRDFGDHLTETLRTLEYDLDFGQGSANGETPLIVSMRRDARQVAQLLIERGRRCERTGRWRHRTLSRSVVGRARSSAAVDRARRRCERKKLRRF